MIARLLTAFGLVLGAVPARAQPYDYFCIFSNQATAEADVNVGQFWNASNATWDLSTTFPGIKMVTPAALVDGISPLTGFWILVSQVTDNPALDAEANCVLKLDRNAAILGKAFVVSASLTGTSRTNATVAPVPQGSMYPEPLGQ